MAEKKVSDTSRSNVPARKKTTKKSTGRRKASPTRAVSTASADNATSGPETESTSAGADTGNNAAAETKVVRPESGGQTVSWVALAFSIVAMCAGGYAWYLMAVDSKLDVGQQEARFNLIEQRTAGFEQMQTDMGSRISQLGNSLARSDAGIDEQIRSVRNAISDQDNSVREQIQNVEKLLNARVDEFRPEFDGLSNSIVDLRSKLGRGADRWIIKEAEQLILIASQRLQFTGETDLAKQALQLADEQLAQLSDPAVNEVRRLLSADMAALDNIRPIDVPGVLNALSALSDQVDTLPLAGDVKLDGASDNADSGRNQETELQEGTGESAALDRYLKPVVNAGVSLLTNLGDLVQVEKNGKSIKPIISAEVRGMIYEKTRLILDSAQIAFIRAKPELYANRIDEARRWVRDNFNPDVAETDNWIKKLDQVGSSLPDSVVPDISESLAAIRALDHREFNRHQEQ